MNARRKLKKLFSKKGIDSINMKEQNGRNEKDHKEQGKKLSEINHSETARANIYSELCSKGSNNMLLVE
jgi:hypothetical protein